MNDAHLVDLGLIEYRQALAVQHALVERRLAGEIPDTLLMLIDYGTNLEVLVANQLGVTTGLPLSSFPEPPV